MIGVQQVHRAYGVKRITDKWERSTDAKQDGATGAIMTGLLRVKQDQHHGADRKEQIARMDKDNLLKVRTGTGQDS